jgi:membrane-associated phospholipid phosphatase
VRPLEIIHLVVIGLIVFLIGLGTAAGRLHNWPQPLAVFAILVIIAFGATMFGRDELQLPKWGRLVLNFYPLITIAAIYEILGWLIPAVSNQDSDALLLRVDRALFGFDPAVELETLATPIFTDVFYVAYVSYFLFPVLLGVLFWRRSTALGREFAFSVTLAFFIVYVGYVLVPAQGPRVSLAGEFKGALEVSPVSQWISAHLNQLEHNRWDVFPSGHVMITILCLIWAFHRENAYFAVGLPVASLLVLSTIYCRVHYVVDVLAGAALAAVAYPLTRRLYRRLLAGLYRPEDRRA